MIYLRLHDRLGNILFMIAAALHLDRNVSVFCNSSRDLSYVSKIIEYLSLPVKIRTPKETITDKHEYYTPTVYKSINYKPGGVMLLDGYFQSYRYFSKKEVIEWFRCPDDLNEQIQKEWGGILDSKETVCVHVRRGDYLKLPERFPFVGKSYLKKAISKFKENNTVFIFTSDDIAWCKKHFSGDNIYYSEDKNEFFDLFLASKCKHNILSNSTFSWWGAYLNGNPGKKVIYPQRWYGPVLAKEVEEEKGELIPDNWVTVKCGWDDWKDYVKAYYRYWRINWRDLVPFLQKH